MTPAVLGFSVLALLASCGDGTPAPLPPEGIICNGAPGLRLLARTSFGAQTFPEQTLQVAISGNCTFWARQVGSASRVHTGVLTAQEADDISRRLDYGAWSKVAGGWPGGGVFDAPAYILWNGTDWIRCDPFCEKRPSTAATVRKAVSGLRELTVTLWEKGQPPDGPVWIHLRDYRNTYNRVTSAEVPIVDWPLARDPLTIAEPHEAQEGGIPPVPAVLIDDPVELKQLHKWMDEPLWKRVGVVFIKRPGIELPPLTYEFELQMRDALPFEDATGHLPWPKNTPMR